MPLRKHHRSARIWLKAGVFKLYVIEFSNGKLYFGITSQIPSRRWEQHKLKKLNRPVCKALLKHDGMMKILAVGERDFIFVLERAAILHFKTTDRRYGYNLTAGGDINPMLGRRHTPEAIAKIIAANCARKRSAETNEKTASTLRGRPLSLERREKIRKSVNRPETLAKITGRPRRSVIILHDGDGR